MRKNENKILLCVIFIQEGIIDERSYFIPHVNSVHNTYTGGGENYANNK